MGLLGGLALATALAGLGYTGYKLTHKKSALPEPEKALQQMKGQLPQTALPTTQTEELDPFSKHIIDALNETIREHGKEMTLQDIDLLLNTATRLLSIYTMASYRRQMAEAGRMRALAQLYSNPLIATYMGETALPNLAP